MLLSYVPSVSLTAERCPPFPAEAGHHPVDFHSLGLKDIRWEIEECDRQIRKKLGYQCSGLRLPGYYFDDRIPPILSELDYSYDSSVLPGAGIYLMYLHYLLFNPAGSDKRFGQWSYLFARRSAYQFPKDDAGAGCWELPLATCPFLTLPIHSTFVFQWGQTYGRLGIGLSRLFRQHSVYLFHAIDLLESSSTGELGSRVGVFRLPASRRRELIEGLLRRLPASEVTLTSEWLKSKPG